MIPKEELNELLMPDIEKMLLYYRRNITSYSPHELILGNPGSGKTSVAKIKIINILLNTDDDVFVIDPDREYAPLMELLGGETIRISIGGKNHINPFDMDLEYADDDNPIALKSDFIQSLCETIVGGRFGLSSSQKSIIDRCVRLLYQPYLQKMANRKNKEITCDFEEMPTMRDFYDLLKAQPQQEAQDLALALEVYAIDNLDVFSHTTNINIDSRLVTYDIEDIGFTMKEIGLQICLNDIWNRVISNRKKGKNTWVFIDEFSPLLNTKSSIYFFQEIFKRARMQGGIITGITQNVEDLLCLEEAKNIIYNCNFITLLRPPCLDDIRLAQLLNIDPDFLSCLLENIKPGQAIIQAGLDTIFPATNYVTQYLSILRSIS